MVPKLCMNLRQNHLSKKSKKVIAVDFVPYEMNCFFALFFISCPHEKKTTNMKTNTDAFDYLDELFTNASTPKLQMSESSDSEDELITQPTPVTEGGSIIKTSIIDEARGASLTKKLQSAKMHMNHALKKFIYNNDEINLKTLKYEDFNHELVGKMGNYFANFARKRANEKNELISLGTACGYMSAFKYYFATEHR